MAGKIFKKKEMKLPTAKKVFRKKKTLPKLKKTAFGKRL